MDYHVQPADGDVEVADVVARDCVRDEVREQQESVEKHNSRNFIVHLAVVG